MEVIWNYLSSFFFLEINFKNLWELEYIYFAKYMSIREEFIIVLIT